MALSDEIRAYEAEQSRLETDHTGKWVLFFGGKLEGMFDTFAAAAAVAVNKFGRGPYLIRQVGAAPVTLPASLMYRPVAHAHS